MGRQGHAPQQAQAGIEGNAHAAAHVKAVKHTGINIGKITGGAHLGTNIEGKGRQRQQGLNPGSGDILFFRLLLF